MDSRGAYKTQRQELKSIFDATLLSKVYQELTERIKERFLEEPSANNIRRQIDSNVGCRP